MTQYEVRYTGELCSNLVVDAKVTEDVECNAGDSWTTIPITVNSVQAGTTIEKSLSFTIPMLPADQATYNRLIEKILQPSPPPLPPMYSSREISNPLYRVEIRAMIGSQTSDWSNPVFVFPTGPIVNILEREFYPEVVASLPLGPGGSSMHNYTVCTDSFSTAAWDALIDESIGGTIEAAIGAWKDAVRWMSHDTNIIEATVTQSSMCPQDDYVRFVSESQITTACTTENRLTLACARSGRIILRDQLSNLNDYSNWSERQPKAECSLLHQTVMHEAGHILGLGPNNTHSDLRNTIMYYSLFQWQRPYCTPQPHDVVATMAQHQSR